MVDRNSNWKIVDAYLARISNENDPFRNIVCLAVAEVQSHRDDNLRRNVARRPIMSWC